MKIFSIKEKQCFPISVERAWHFFSNPENLQRITPPSLGFKITSEVPGTMHVGTIVTYRIRPILGIPRTWITEITHVAEPHFFVDEQRFGPYRFWHHQHFFRAIPEGVEIRDIVHYALRAGPLSSFVNALLVQKQLQRIFRYRRSALAELFGKLPCDNAA